MRTISWNIDSFNAALTGDSARALLSKAVLEMIIGYNPEIIALQETKLSSNIPEKKHLEILKDKLPGYKIVLNSSAEPARKGYAGTLFIYKNDLNPIVTYPAIGAPGRWIWRAESYPGI